MFTKRLYHDRKDATPWRPIRLSSAALAAALATGVLPAISHADKGVTYTHAEISLGFPNGQVTVGRTWETGGRIVTVTHELPEAVEEDCDQDDETVVIEKTVEKPTKVIVVERREPEVVVIERRVTPRPRQVVVVHEAPRPRRVVVVEPRRQVTVIHRDHDYHHGYDHGHRSGGHAVYRPSGPSHGHQPNRPKELFSSSNPRPQRDRGVQQIRVGR